MSTKFSLLLFKPRLTIPCLPIDGVRFTARVTQGVRLFNVKADEKVVSVAWLVEEEGEEEGDTGDNV
jgi:hypothetical protein